jgi:hypothetical protein
MAVATDTMVWARAGRPVADRITLARAILLRIRAALGEPRLRRCRSLDGGRSDANCTARICPLRRYTTGEDGSDHARSQQPEEVSAQHLLRSNRRLERGRSVEYIAV